MQWKNAQKANHTNKAIIILTMLSLKALIYPKHLLTALTSKATLVTFREPS